MRHAQVTIDCLEPRNPHPCRLAVLFGFLLVVALKTLVLFAVRLLAIAVMCFVIENQDIL